MLLHHIFLHEFKNIGLTTGNTDLNVCLVEVHITNVKCTIPVYKSRIYITYQYTIQCIVYTYLGGLISLCHADFIARTNVLVFTVTVLYRIHCVTI
jgi:ABC-type xylose transport system permease subunit